MSTVLDKIRMEKDTNLAYIEDSIIGNGPYVLAPQFQHLSVDRHVWTYEWPQAHLKKFHHVVFSV